MFNEYLSKRFSTTPQETYAKTQEEKYQKEKEKQEALINDQESSTREFKINGRGFTPGVGNTRNKTTNPRSKEVMEQKRQQQAAITKQAANKWEVTVWRDINIFNSTPVFAQVGITEDMIRSNKVPGNYVDAALKLLYRGYAGDGQNKAITPNKEQYNSIISAAQANPQGPLSSKINAHVAAITKAEEKAKNKQHKEYIKNIRNGGNSFNSVNVKKSKEENIQTLVRSMDAAYSEYMNDPENTEKEAVCDDLFKKIEYLVTNNETTKILIAEAILNLRNGNTPPWLDDNDMEEINKLLNTTAAENVRRLRAQDVDVFENDATLWKDKSTGQNINISQL